MAMHMPVFDAWQTAWAYADVLAMSFAPDPVWQQQQTRRLGELLRAAARSAIYRERIGEAVCGSSDPWQTLRRMRPVTRRELMQRFSDWVTDPALSLPALRTFLRDRGNRGEAFAGRYVAWESSGSSGEPAVFVQDARCFAVSDALEAARGPVSLLGATPWASPRIALVGATEGHFASVVAFERARQLNPWLGAASRALSFLQPIERLVEQLDEFAPTVLATYPSMAWVLSEEQVAGRLRLALRAVWTGGETLTAPMRRALADRFRAPVHDVYGASECFIIAAECRVGSLHVNADWVVLESVDASMCPLPAGEVGHTTLLTNLVNHAQPIVRYDLGDRVRFVPGRCDCGSTLPVIEVQGRSDDVLTLEDRRGRPVHLAPLALTTVLEDDAGVFDFQLCQHGTHALQLTVYEPGCGPRAESALRGFLRGRGLGGTRVRVFADAGGCSRGHSGKQQRVVCDRRAAEQTPRLRRAGEGKQQA